MARGLSAQQRRLLAAAYAKLRGREAEYQKTIEARAHLDTVLAAWNASRGRKPEPPKYGPAIPPPHITHADALLTLYGWRSGTQDRDYWQRRRRIPSDRMRVATGYGRHATNVVATIGRDEYEVAQASTSRTLRRLVERGLLERHHRYGYLLTEAGEELCADLAMQDVAA